ncbi:pilus assembly PilX family protein [Gymnodinialimonas sp.]
MNSSFSEQRGFALIVVLAILIVLTLLYALATSQVLANAQRMSARALVAEQFLTNSIAVEIAVRHPDGAVAASRLLVEWQDGRASFFSQAAAGLIDINTAHPEVLSSVLSDAQMALQSLYLAEEAAVQFAQSSRFSSVSEFGRLVQATDPLDRSLFTVHSGLERPNVAQVGSSFGNAPADVEAMNQGSFTGTLHLIQGRGGSRHLLGVIYRSPGLGGGRVFSLDVE